MVKIDVDAVGRMLAGPKTETRPGYDGGMASFTLDGETFEYLKPDPGHQPEETKSLTYGNYPKVLASVPLLTTAGTRTGLAAATRMPDLRSDLSMAPRFHF
ncbi:hypothetical protein QFZ65_001098 [Arthrobacter sp. B3I9]|uniref:hypothetical protein n=1 Tax=Arthrobacter sp. B3I9 TaxID=3042270 RepID=UPI00278FE664|nr:hypothetical protein [Arthrobacter sp. B3I9]MDQ0849160.1 hypothetical protein [Arthrobacter sp. B3I9]